jgi:hypothetical protein
MRGHANINKARVPGREEQCRHPDVPVSHMPWVSRMEAWYLNEIQHPVS